MLSLDNEVQKKDIAFSKRPPIDLNWPSRSLYSLGPHYECFGARSMCFPHQAVYYLKFSALSKEEVKWFEHIFQNSYFSKNSNLAIEAIQYFTKEEFGHFVCIILPLFEQSLRKLYACINPSLSPSILVAAGLIFLILIHLIMDILFCIC